MQQQQLDDQPQALMMGMLSVQVCVPDDWTDEQALELAEQKYPCGTTHGWSQRRAGCDRLAGAPERAPCAGRAGFVHIMFDA